MANYNPYEDVKRIVDAKSMYNMGKATGSPNYRQYQERAKQYYDNLVRNGYGDVSDYLSSVDYDKAKKYLKRFKPTDSVDQYYSDLTKQAVKNAQNPQLSETTEAMLNSFYDSDRNLSGLGDEHYQTGKNQLDYLNNFDVTKQSYFDPIMSQYNYKGDVAKNQEYADSAASNAGNIDSYAAANANRQQLAFTNAGMQAVLNQANQNQMNWRDVYAQMSADLQNRGAMNNEKLGYAGQMYATDSAERQNALNRVIDADVAYRQSAVDELLGRLGYENERYLADRSLEGTKYQTDRSLEGTKYQTDADLAGTQAQTQAQLGAAQIAADADRYAAQQDYNAARYKADQDYNRAVYEANAQHTRANAEAEANATPDNSAEQDVWNTMYTLFDMIGTENGPANLNEVRNVAYQYYGGEYLDLIDDIIRQYSTYASKGKFGIPVETDED